MAVNYDLGSELKTTELLNIRVIGTARAVAHELIKEAWKRYGPEAISTLTPFDRFNTSL